MLRASPVEKAPPAPVVTQSRVRTGTYWEIGNLLGEPCSAALVSVPRMDPLSYQKNTSREGALISTLGKPTEKLDASYWADLAACRQRFAEAHGHQRPRFGSQEPRKQASSLKGTRAPGQSEESSKTCRESGGCIIDLCEHFYFARATALHGNMIVPTT
jgi:hypothetical protein